MFISFWKKLLLKWMCMGWDGVYSPLHHVYRRKGCTGWKSCFSLVAFQVINVNEVLFNLRISQKLLRDWWQTPLMNQSCCVDFLWRSSPSTCSDVLRIPVLLNLLVCDSESIRIVVFKGVGTVIWNKEPLGANILQIYNHGNMSGLFPPQIGVNRLRQGIWIIFEFSLCFY